MKLKAKLQSHLRLHCNGLICSLSEHKDAFIATLLSLLQSQCECEFNRQ